MDRLNYKRKKSNLSVVKPCEVFDLIGGTSTRPCLIAIMLGRLGMDLLDDETERGCANNLVDEVKGEASNIWYSETGDLKPLVKCFISIGTGNPGKAFEDSIIKFLYQMVVQIATETENTEKRFIARGSDGRVPHPHGTEVPGARLHWRVVIARASKPLTSTAFVLDQGRKGGQKTAGRVPADSKRQHYFKAVLPEERSPNNPCVSCILWEKKDQYFVTSVNTIALLEALVGMRFTLEEKNRIGAIWRALNLTRFPGQRINATSSD
ncbi:uncharacterized protein K441DRAFT_682703 [Cenococcum geophilum 1.58]|uniref:Uncharacterized protein n=1 Tax=Cenococcum geophilum 1.58 TaxID=794803 RepID=A0ACC8ELT7_9PEZI|nr:hypothetical protein K441DRAFT_682703 [Cenococcum geophilum 1.58]